MQLVEARTIKDKLLKEVTGDEMQEKSGEWAFNKTYVF